MPTIFTEVEEATAHASCATNGGTSFVHPVQHLRCTSLSKSLAPYHMDDASRWVLCGPRRRKPVGSSSGLLRGDSASNIIACMIVHALPPSYSSPLKLFLLHSQEKARASNVFMADDALARAKVTFRWEGWSSQQVRGRSTNLLKLRRVVFSSLRQNC